MTNHKNHTIELKGLDEQVTRLVESKLLSDVEENSKAESEDTNYEVSLQPISKEFDLKKIAKAQGYKGTNLKDLIGKWPGEETTDELLAMLK